MIDDLLARLACTDVVPGGELLVEFAGSGADRRAALADLIGLAALWITPSDDPPADGAAAVAWAALVSAAHGLNSSGVHALGRPPFITDSLLVHLLDEAGAQRPAGHGTSGRATARAGDVLAGLAVSRQLREAVGEALGVEVVPTYDAIYEYDSPGSHVRTHLDARHYEFVVHLLIAHTQPPGGAAASVLVTHHPGIGGPRRLRLLAGEAVVLRGRGTLHSWKALGEGEHRTLTAIGFELAT